MKRMTVYHKSGFLKWRQIPMREKYTLTITTRELIAYGCVVFWIGVSLVLATKYVEVRSINERITKSSIVTFTLPNAALSAPTNLNIEAKP